MAQQQQSNMVKPQKVGGLMKMAKKTANTDMSKLVTKKGAKINESGMKMRGMDNQPSMPSKAKVEKSIRKTMGY